MRILFFIAGVGAGNTTRAMAIVEELKAQSPQIDVQFPAQGKALELLGRHFTVHPMHSVTYSQGGTMNALSILSSNLMFPRKYLQNRAAAEKLIKELRPDVVIADSDFYCLPVARKLGVPLISINNSAAVVEHMNKVGIPPNCQFSARFIEQTDYWLQRRYPDLVIAPVLTPVEGLAAKFKQTSPIVRRGFKPSSENSDEVVVVTGGSGIGTQDIDLRSVQLPMSTFGSALKNVPPQAKQLGFSVDDLEPMRRAKVLVVQGGFSSVSEAAVLQRPTVVVPIARHAEQHVNAQLFEQLGLGLASSGPDAGAKVNQILANYEQFSKPHAKIQIQGNGAEQTASLILEFARA